MKSKKNVERKKRAAVRVQRVVRAPVIVDASLGNWFVCEQKPRRVICMCSRVADATEIAHALNGRKEAWMAGAAAGAETAFDTLERCFAKLKTTFRTLRPNSEVSERALAQDETHSDTRASLD